MDNIPRVLPKGLGCYVDAATWPQPPIFKFLMRTGDVEPLEMARTFNNGIGLILVIAPDMVQPTLEILKPGDAHVYKIGEVTDKPGVEMRSLDTWI